MSTHHSTTSESSGKPAKPYAEFPLFPHASGQWAKKIRGRMHYFGSWEDPDAALQSYLVQKDDLHAGRTTRPEAGILHLKELVNRFVNEKQAMVDDKELSAMTWRDYKIACDEVIAAFGKNRLVTDLRTEDFAALRKKMAAKWGPHLLNKKIQFVRCLFKFADDAELIDRPIRFGPGFKLTPKRELRLHRAAQGPMLFTASDIRRMIDAATLSLRAMILLGINYGFGNSDCGNLTLSAVDLDNAMIDFPRPKTGIPRRCPLWPETVVALRDALGKRPKPKSDEYANHVFLTIFGVSWDSNILKRPLSYETSKLLKRINIKGHKRLNFYALRHTFRTVAASGSLAGFSPRRGRQAIRLRLRVGHSPPDHV